MEYCLSKEQIEDYAAGRVPDEEKARLNEHIVACKQCKSAVLAGAVRTFGGLEPAMTACPSPADLSRYADGELGAGLEDEIREHLWRCGPCREASAELASLHRLRRPEAARFPARVRFLPIAAAATAAVCVAAVLLVYSGHGPRPATQVHIAQKPTKVPTATPPRETVAVRPGPKPVKPMVVALVGVGGEQAGEAGAAAARAVSVEVKDTQQMVLADASVAGDVRLRLNDLIERGSTDPLADPDIVVDAVSMSSAAVDRVVVWNLAVREQASGAPPAEGEALQFPVDIEIRLMVVDKPHRRALLDKTLTGTASAPEALQPTVERILKSAIRRDVRPLLARASADGARGKR